MILLAHRGELPHTSVCNALARRTDPDGSIDRKRVFTGLANPLGTSGPPCPAKEKTGPTAIGTGLEDAFAPVEYDALESRASAPLLDAVVSLWLAMQAGGPRFTRVLAATLRGTLTRDQRFTLLMAATMAADLDDAQDVGAAILRAKRRKAA